MRTFKIIFTTLFTFFSLTLVFVSAQRISPEELIYMGAFRLPAGLGDSEVRSWNYSGHAMTYYPFGDPSGPDDGFPGSIFAAGHAWEHLVSEISIPIPVISAGKNLAELNTASTLQPFQNIMNVGHLEIPRTGLAFLPKQGSQATDKIYFCWGYHMQEGSPDLTHGWFELNLSHPQIKRGWFLGGQPAHIRNISSNDYLFEIPAEWADIHTPGLRLATGRYRDGGWSGQGPSLFAIGPWNEGNPPPSGTALRNIPLLLYTSTYDSAGENFTLNEYHHSDEWSGAVWVTAAAGSAVLFIGTKGIGACWYGDENGPGLDVENRGWWSDEFHGQVLFYDTDELAKVASGVKQPWEPQPYAALEIDDYLYSVDSIQEKYHVNAACFDRARGYLYVFEFRADGDKPLTHVWKVEPVPDSPLASRKKTVFRR